MEYRVRNGNGLICELTITNGNTTMMEDMATDNFKVPQSEIEKLIRAAIELSRFNKTSDADFIISIIDDWSDDTDRETIVEYIQKINQ